MTRNKSPNQSTNKASNQSSNKSSNNSFNKYYNKYSKDDNILNEMNNILGPYEKDKRIAELYKDPTIRKELAGSYKDSMNNNPKTFASWLNKNKIYADNHIIQISKYLNKNDKILELAGAAGWASAMLSEMGYKNILLSDINPFDYNGLAAVKRITKYPIKTRIMSFEEIDLPMNSFKAVFMVSSLHHSSNVNNVARQVNRVLKNHGRWFIIGEPVRGLFDPKNLEMLNSNKSGFNDHFYYWWHYRKEIKRAGFRVQVLFPLEFHKMLSREIPDNCRTPYKRVILYLAKALYRLEIGRFIIQKMYPYSLYFIGSHSIIMCEKIK